MYRKILSAMGRLQLLPWWAVIGLFVTLFAFAGVNMFLPGCIPAASCN